MVQFSAKKVKGQGHSEVTKSGKSLSLSIGQISIAHKSMETNNIALKWYAHQDMPKQLAIFRVIAQTVQPWQAVHFSRFSPSLNMGNQKIMYISLTVHATAKRSVISNPDLQMNIIGQYYIIWPKMGRDLLLGQNWTLAYFFQKWWLGHGMSTSARIFVFWRSVC